MSFLERVRQFMAGRYGMDSFNVFLLCLAGFFWLINILVWAFVPSLILWLIEAALVAWAVFRALSRNINMRALENRRYNNFSRPFTMWVKLQFKKFRERKEYKYLKCPTCKAQLRVKRKQGGHTVRCPKCKQEFKVKI